MKNILALVLLVTFLSGCAGYKFQKGTAPYDKGYVVSREGISVVEYTLGANNTVPDDLKIAQERFKRRRGMVEHLYKKMDLMANRFKETFWDSAANCVKLIGGLFWTPVRLLSDYRYHHSPSYKAAVDAQEAVRSALEEARIRKAKDQLTLYITNDLAKEESPLK